jgi:hypothetical protein
MLSLSDEALASLPIDERSLAILRDLLDTEEWSEHNYLLKYRGGAARAVAEGLAWLRGLVLQHQRAGPLRPGEHLGAGLGREHAAGRPLVRRGEDQGVGVQLRHGVHPVGCTNSDSRQVRLRQSSSPVEWAMELSLPGLGACLGQDDLR